MNFRDRVQSIIAAEENPLAETFEGYGGLRPRRVCQNEGTNARKQAEKCGVGDTFLESFKRRSEYQFFRGKKSPLDEPERGNAIPQTRLGEEHSKPSKGAPLIEPELVRAAVEREVRALERIGRTGGDAFRDAVEITRAKVRNSEALAETQSDNRLCHVCGGWLDDTAPVISVMTGRPGNVLHVHSRCHEALCLRLSEKVENVMATAGYGIGWTGVNT